MGSYGGDKGNMGDNGEDSQDMEGSYGGDKGSMGDFYNGEDSGNMGDSGDMGDFTGGDKGNMGSYGGDKGNFMGGSYGGDKSSFTEGMSGGRGGRRLAIQNQVAYCASSNECLRSLQNTEFLSGGLTAFYECFNFVDNTVSSALTYISTATVPDSTYNHYFCDEGYLICEKSDNTDKPSTTGMYSTTYSAEEDCLNEATDADTISCLRRRVASLKTDVDGLSYNLDQTMKVCNEAKDAFSQC